MLLFAFEVKFLEIFVQYLVELQKIINAKGSEFFEHFYIVNVHCKCAGEKLVLFKAKSKVG